MSEPPCKKGDRIRLIEMGPDPDPIPAGTTGTVRGLLMFSDGTGQVSVKWDINRSLTLIVPQDKFEVIP